MTRVAELPELDSRIIGEVGRHGDGALLVVIASIHGNEPAGTLASMRVIEQLRDHKPLSGRFVAIAGNLGALAEGRRFIDFDLNRAWLDPAPPDEFLGHEADELVSLRRALEQELENASGAVAVLDLHSTSASSPPFSVISDSLANRDMARRFGIPLVLGLEEEVRGSLLNHLGDRGIVAVGIEGGQHEDPVTVDNHEAAIWITMEHLGITRADERARGMIRRLAEAGDDLPAVVELVHRHRIAPEASFEISRGFRGFEPVRQGEEIAREDGASVEAARDGVVMLPRYQPVGEDGFFIGRPVNPFWLSLSAVLRESPLARLLPMIPGVRSSSDGVTMSERWGLLGVRIMHLFGYRRWPNEKGRMTFRRRPEPPPQSRSKKSPA